MDCINCKDEMSSAEAEPWISAYTCGKCGISLEIHHHDLMSGCMTAATYIWDIGEGFKITYDEGRDGEIINQRTNKEKE